MVVLTLLGSVSIQSLSAGFKQQCELLAFFLVLRIFPVNIQAIKTPVSHDLDSTRGEALAGLRRLYCIAELAFLGEGPATDGEERLELAVFQLVKVQLLDVPVGVLAGCFL
jgi:hypothetical protein